MPRFDPSCIDVLDYLECLDIRNVERATMEEARFSCPYPSHIKGDETPSAYMNLETTAFHCHSCKEKGNAISFAADVLGVSPIAAIRMLKQRYSPSGIDPDSRCMVEEIRKILYKPKLDKRINKIYDDSVLSAYHCNWDFDDAKTVWGQYIFGRGFDRSTLISWQFGYSKEFDRITLPIRDEEGRLVGIKARACDDRKPKYLNLNDHSNGISSYLKNEVIFALDRVIRESDKLVHEHGLIVVEGEFNAIAMHALGYMNTVAINGSYFGERQIHLLKQYAECVILFFDSDRSGYEAVRTVGDKLHPFIRVYVAPDHEGDPMDMHRYSIRKCIDNARGYQEVSLARQ